MLNPSFEVTLFPLASLRRPFSNFLPYITVLLEIPSLGSWHSSKGICWSQIYLLLPLTLLRAKFWFLGQQRTSLIPHPHFSLLNVWRQLSDPPPCRNSISKCYQPLLTDWCFQAPLLCRPLAVLAVFLHTCSRWAADPQSSPEKQNPGIYVVFCFFKFFLF